MMWFKFSLGEKEGCGGQAGEQRIGRSISRMRGEVERSWRDKEEMTRDASGVFKGRVPK